MAADKASIPVARARWDAEAKVFVATSDDIRGLVTEAATFEDLTEAVLDAAALLLADVKREDRPLRIRIIAETEEAVPAAA